MQAVQRQIAQDLKVQPPFKDIAALEAEVARRITFIQCCLHNARLKTLVLGISGGVDSLTAGLMAQRAVQQLREQTGDQAYRVIAVRLPYGVQHDEADATAAVDFINPDERQTVNIGPAVKALAAEVARRHILVNAVSPGFIETDMTQNLPVEKILPAIPLGRFGKPWEVAEAVSFLASEKAAYITGQTIAVNGGAYL